MKREAYFTVETIVSKSREMLDALSSLSSRHADITFRRERSALLVLDMQEYFLRPASHAFIPSALAILPNLQLLISNYRSSNLLIIFTRHVNTNADAAMMSRWWRDVIRADALDSVISPALDSSAGITIEKSQYDAFYKTSLEEVLRSRGVEQVVITGVMTHLCCETTARSAFVRGFEVFFCVDGTATYTEAFHRASLLNLSHGFAVPVLSADVAMTSVVPSG
ncbi:MAG: isochorismatase family protein [Chloroflexi bacterium]|nr:isochorismatase family protein [Chloroflexota bacterium]